MVRRVQRFWRRKIVTASFVDCWNRTRGHVARRENFEVLFCFWREWYVWKLKIFECLKNFFLIICSEKTRKRHSFLSKRTQISWCIFVCRKKRQIFECIFFENVCVFRTPGNKIKKTFLKKKVFFLKFLFRKRIFFHKKKWKDLKIAKERFKKSFFLKIFFQKLFELFLRVFQKTRKEKISRKSLLSELNR